ncbi:tRNA (adenine(22)-N(1))-methyltransferase [Calderihabitans maritimus]|uniref:SAM-dependent methyltransferase n=1 Tax=Calderihabitans maritimus TaxID=1246530 RepID=A0A1Z5HN29_9FIRM|nr:class I SAM-dependent methyltransferase [Calderihabitans maritimus]GAW90932.1 hypothetical protein Desku_2598 [Calderihabitans maritimus]
MKISKRLTAIASLVKPGSVLGDIGTDHALLPVYLVKNQICPRVIATDVAPEPLKRGEQLVRSHNLVGRISMRLGYGLKPLRPGEVDTVVIAGLGGKTMVDILSASPEIVRGLNRLILQPMVAGEVVRKWLVTNGWKIAEEELVKEDNHIYEIILAEPGHQEPLHPLQLELGPVLMAKKHPLLVELTENRLAEVRGILESLYRSKTREARQKEEQFRERAKELEEVLEWLSRASK